MLTSQDKYEIQRIIAETVATSGLRSIRKRKRAGEIEQLERRLNIVAKIHDLLVNEGFTELEAINPKTGERRIVKAALTADSIVEVTARAMEVFGSRDKALRWLKAPVRSLGDQTPLSLLDSPEGLAQVQDTLGRVEHGVW
ncbi:MAG: antitoxin Xre/MbcA/ParS toxin-binding domain-containing protein [Bryobacteraceae bacterium]|jgi:putative toxin-antitoxin system antitoxin component (TIGR02293 family)